KLASKEVARASTEIKNKALEAIAKALLENEHEIVVENAKDVLMAKINGVKASLIDRLALNHERVAAMHDSLIDIAKLPDPLGETVWETERPNGLVIEKRRVPMGVIGIIYEARPNVTVDAAALCLKAGSSVILKGGSDAIFSNIAITKVMREAVSEFINPDCIQLIEDTSRESTMKLMKLNKYVDLLIPRGGAGLIRTVVENATVPVIETGTGNCHIFVDESADIDMAVKILINAKTQRTGVCNAAESLLVHKNIADAFLPAALKELFEKGCEVRGCEATCSFSDNVKLATDEDYATEFLDLIISVKVVNDLKDAVEHINTYSTGHSESIITNDEKNAELFLNEVDSAAVYVNASTRFTDGGEFGFGAEMGISTQKMHARGPMGLREITTTKYVVKGNGQIR
ncbi:MAG: glutamate-5-semialdehyde dehydrogenase, partial [Clostridia bacterium]|nr:glutamate-5-semialdehyde dehydrogenase [Clostridia bacterium]